MDDLASAEEVALAVKDDEVERLIHSVGTNLDCIAVGSTTFKVFHLTRLVRTGAKNIDVPLLELEKP